MRRPFFARVAAVATLTLLLAAAGEARAGDPALAEHLFKEGLAAMKRAEASGKAEDYKAACDAFQGSDEADASVGARINVGLCSEKQSKFASAWAAYKEAANLAKERGDTDRMQTALSEAARVEPKRHMIVINVPQPRPEGLSVTRDGIVVPAVALGTELPVDPGEHTIDVTAKGKKPWSTKVTSAASGPADRVEVPALEDAPVAGGGTGPAPGDANYTPPVIVSSDGSGQRTVGIVVGGVGVLAIVAAVGVQILASNEASERDKQREEEAKAQDPVQRAAFADSAESHDKAAKNDQLIAIITGAGGVVMLGVGAVLYFTASKSSSSSGKPTVVPMLGRGFAGVGLGGTF